MISGLLAVSALLSTWTGEFNPNRSIHSIHAPSNGPLVKKLTVHDEGLHGNRVMVAAVVGDDAAELKRMVVMVWCGGIVVERRWGDKGVWHRLWWVGRSWPKMRRHRWPEKGMRGERDEMGSKLK
nr:hypothetical protein [Tanacetum cinerariifolium]